MNSAQATTMIGAVVIGRNEGERLVNCFDALQKQLFRIVYVDSGSTDNSLSAARERGIEVVCLDMSLPFTAARARNAGFKRLLNQYPDITYVQFLDGDCKLNEGWVENASNYLNQYHDVGLVCGRRKELFPERSVYNWLCDLEWNTPVGEARACGGDFLVRTSVFAKVDGFREDMIAGEEPELCIRIRQARWKIYRLDADMTWHDANIIHFSQWWKRTVRAGYAFALGAYLHGKGPEKHWVKESNRAWLWGGVIPVMILLSMLMKPVVGCLLLLIYPVQIVRVAYKSHLPFKQALLNSCYLMLGKFAEIVGKFKFLWQVCTKTQGRLIEYK